MPYVINSETESCVWKDINEGYQLQPCEIFSDDPIVIRRWSRNLLLNKVREARELALNRLMGIAFAAKEANDAATVSAVLDARLALLNITAAPGVSTATNDAELGAALVMAYAAIVNAAPINVKTAFAGFNL